MPLEQAILALNLLTFVIMGIDKKRARNKLSRVPEKLLLLLALCGGSAGVWFGMKIFRHKTKHALFSAGIPLVISLQVLALLYFSLRQPLIRR